MMTISIKSKFIIILRNKLTSMLISNGPLPSSLNDFVKIFNINFSVAKYFQEYDNFYNYWIYLLQTSKLFINNASIHKECSWSPLENDWHAELLKSFNLFVDYLFFVSSYQISFCQFNYTSFFARSSNHVVSLQLEYNPY